MCYLLLSPRLSTFFLDWKLLYLSYGWLINVTFSYPLSESCLQQYSCSALLLRFCSSAGILDHSWLFSTWLNLSGFTVYLYVHNGLPICSLPIFLNLSVSCNKCAYGIRLVCPQYLILLTFTSFLIVLPITYINVFLVFGLFMGLQTSAILFTTRYTLS